MVKIPILLKVMALVVSLTAFYSYIGSMVPQIEVHPPQVTQLKENIGVEEMVREGQKIFEGKGTCTLCHTIGKTSDALRFPDLEGIGARAGHRVDGQDALTYLTKTLYEPNVYIVDGFFPGMPAANRPPVDLTDDEILIVIAYLQSLGAEPTVTMKTRLPIGGKTGSLSPARTTSLPPPPVAVDAAAPLADPAVAKVADVADVADVETGAIENGRKIYQRTCVVCHGDQAQGNELLNAPRLDVQEAWYLSRQLENFSLGIRGGDPKDIFGSQMRPMAMILNGEQEIADVSAYIASLR